MLICIENIFDMYLLFIYIFAMRPNLNKENNE